MTPRRYQLTKEATAIVGRGHPWIFRDQLSSAASVFRDGDRLSLVDGANRVVGYGLFEAEGAIAIRILRRGPARPDAAWLRSQLAAALARRAPLAARTDGIRLVHGESDGIPAVVVDRFGDTLVATSYAAGADGLARYAAGALGALAEPSAAGRRDPTAHVLLRPAHRRRAPAEPARVLRGAPPEIARFTEDGLAFAVDLAGGQKTGAYLDLRGLRRAVATQPLAGARVLNLFAYSGMLGRAAEAAGAASITQVDSSPRALAFAAAHHVTDPARHHFVTADVFDWLPALAAGDGFDLVIVDPPAMTSRKAQVPAALAAYRKLYRAAARHVRGGGALVAACCTSRIERATFHRVVREALGGDFAFERELPPEPDHPIASGAGTAIASGAGTAIASGAGTATAFPEADYLKIGWWRRG